MKKFFKSISICFMLALLFIGSFTLAGCNFTVDYESTSKKLNNAIAKIDDNENFHAGKVSVNGKDFEVDKIPNVAQNFSDDKDNYAEISRMYDSMFSYAVDYIKDCAELLATPPTVESLTEIQENLYKTLESEIEVFSKAIDDFSEEITEINKFYNNLSNYGASSKEVFVLNYKKEYRDFIYECFDLANVMEDIMGSVYQEIDYKELNGKEGKVFKSLESGINVRIFEGYFSFIVDSFDCRTPTENVDANEYMVEILQTYANSKQNYMNFYVALKSSTASHSYTAEEINQIKETINVYFDETALFQEAYDKLNFVKFYFDDDCALKRYVEDNYANKNYYEKLVDYINNTLPNLTDYVESKFFV